MDNVLLAFFKFVRHVYMSKNLLCSNIDNETQNNSE